MSDVSDKLFWQRIPLAQMSQAQWESLCDGCGKCCLHKLEDEDSGEVFYTDIACRYLSADCRCVCYAQRAKKVAACVTLRPQDLATVTWLPSTCAYRLLSEGKALPDWHPLVTGDANSVHACGQSVKGKFVPEQSVDEDDYEDHIVFWPQ
ncbi:MAG TPA: YcgN family cysteine cluster protein [Spongiibacteraceae bacterium]|nr:YcgN family cysteine cluster protein [Spongiibacteraceae bacterium]